jgi:hypothetical protein
MGICKESRSGDVEVLFPRSTLAAGNGEPGRRSGSIRHCAPRNWPQPPALPVSASRVHPEAQ